MRGDHAAGETCPALRVARSAYSPEPIPPFGILLHLLAATATLAGTLVWGLLALTGVIRVSLLGLAVASVTMTASFAWYAALWRLTKELGESLEDEVWCACPPGDASAEPPEN